MCVGLGQEAQGVDALLIKSDGHDSLLIEWCVNYGHGLSGHETEFSHAGLPEPVPRGILANEIEVPHLCMDKMVCNGRHDIRESAVRDDRNFLDSLNMLFEELQVSKHRGKVFPAGKRV